MKENLIDRTGTVKEMSTGLCLSVDSKTNLLSSLLTSPGYGQQFRVALGVAVPGRCRGEAMAKLITEVGYEEEWPEFGDPNNRRRPDQKYSAS
jgi:hypothetical protein